MKKQLVIAVLALGLSACSSVVPTATETAFIERKHFGNWEQGWGYTQVVKIGDRLLLSGLTGEGTNMSQHLTHIYGTLSEILTEYNLTPENVVMERVFTTDIEAFKQTKDVRLVFTKKVCTQLLPGCK
ncbi:hypothetical protein HR060_07190 [Catenovulum sp. SM1970]|uniref:Rid family hydrolase n=1 Tax=Marinifaba aquimaris TaxID=2741323 RepID=UPI0015718B43|nr:Rid family hydrolase [Marinifaba aquimaris]NTS76651.1 hypothetical protein [Marinifaba aquimaris]